MRKLIFATSAVVIGALAVWCISGSAGLHAGMTPITVQAPASPLALMVKRGPELRVESWHAF
jgi:hypothetical protein